MLGVDIYNQNSVWHITGYEIESLFVATPTINDLPSGNQLPVKCQKSR